MKRCSTFLQFREIVTKCHFLPINTDKNLTDWSHNVVARIWETQLIILESLKLLFQQFLEFYLCYIIGSHMLKSVSVFTVLFHWVIYYYLYLMYFMLWIQSAFSVLFLTISFHISWPRNTSLCVSNHIC